MDRITAEIHAQVDSFLQRMVDADGGRIDAGGLQSALRSILPQSDERPSIYAGNASSARYLIAAYAIHKGEQIRPGARFASVRQRTRLRRYVSADGLLTTAIESVFQPLRSRSRPISSP